MLTSFTTHSYPFSSYPFYCSRLVSPLSLPRRPLRLYHRIIQQTVPPPIQRWSPHSVLARLQLPTRPTVQVLSLRMDQAPLLLFRFLSVHLTNTSEMPLIGPVNTICLTRSITSYKVASLQTPKLTVFFLERHKSTELRKLPIPGKHVASVEVEALGLLEKLCPTMTLILSTNSLLDVKKQH